MKSIGGKILLWALIVVAAGISFFSSFRNSVETASIVETDSGAILRVIVLNGQNPAADEPLRLKISYVAADKKTPAGAPLELPLPQPFVAVLADGSGKVAARLGEPDATGCVPAIEEFPRHEKYLYVGFPNIATGGKPTSLMFKNPFAN
ncbi:MAG: hypothetical protein LUD52_00340 [Opitutae bacterium]|nr:hypothetical protein [Opitutae bacterium]